MLGSSPATRARAALKGTCALVAGASTTFGIRLLVIITATEMALRKNRDVIVYAPFPQAMLPGINNEDGRNARRAPRSNRRENRRYPKRHRGAGSVHDSAEWTLRRGSTPKNQ